MQMLPYVKNLYKIFYERFKKEEFNDCSETLSPRKV